MDTILVGALRREKMADNAVQKLVAEIEDMNRLVRIVGTSSYLVSPIYKVLDYFIILNCINSTVLSGLFLLWHFCRFAKVRRMLDKLK